MPARSAVVEMICKGAPREMGFAQGAAARSQRQSISFLPCLDGAVLYSCLAMRMAILHP